MYTRPYSLPGPIELRFVAIKAVSFKIDLFPHADDNIINEGQIFSR
jgi:hypothetical protein